MLPPVPVRSVRKEGSLMTILVVDDEPVLCHVISRVVRKLCPSAIPIDNPTVADVYESLVKHAVTAVITDFNLPDGTALDVLVAVHAHDATIPVIVMSADASRACDVVTAGATAFLAKPFNVVDLVRLLGQLDSCC